ncbi:uncharacterized protein BX664DRAFT_273000 [Halteromyces radiatus]|uniref:uncharacterized protein n=1 Tax=Halteromyces radiatus TaxID=101107 RepID=UPI00221ECA16|nr:uncharacterized protein BX664DRAFT_273000 [Halteromyces radiatus]KAI8099644.1 hypothetical protein BX664DRAFT_273000 [Halteromyces radiatus]
MTTLTDQLVTIVFGLADLTISIPQLNISLPVLELIHALLINYAYRTGLSISHTNIGWGQGFLATIVMCAGGGSTVALLRGEPLGILKSNRFWGIYGTTYWLMFSNPYVYPFVDYLFSIPALEQVLTVADGILRNFAITRVGIEGVALNPLLGDDKWVAKLICGTLAGCGGGFWIDTFKLTQEHWTFSTPRFLHSPSIDMKASFASTLFYLISTNSELADLLGFTVLSQTEAQAWSAMVLSSGLVYKSYINRLNNNNRFNKTVPTTQIDNTNEKKDE